MAHAFSIKFLRHRHNRIGDAGAKRLARAIKVLEARTCKKCFLQDVSDLIQEYILQ